MGASAVAVGFALLATPALAGSSPSAALYCPSVETSQPFLAFGDPNFYALVPNGNFSETSGGGWQLSGGAQIVKTTLPNGQTGNALSLPHGAKAVSPLMCVDASYLGVRTWVKAIKAPGVGVTAVVAGHRQSQTINGPNGIWTSPQAVNVLPGGINGLAQLHLELQSMGSGGSVLVYDLYVDPRHR